MKFQKTQINCPYQIILRDLFYEIGGLYGTYQPENQVECLNPPWRKDLVKSAGTLASDEILNLIKQIHNHEQFEKFLVLAWDDDSEARALFRKDRIRIIVDISAIKATFVNQIVANACLSAYKLEGTEL